MTLPCGRCHVDAATTTLTLPLHRWRCYHHWDITTTILTLPPANYCCSYNHSLTPSPQKHHTIIDAAALQSLPMTALVTLFSWGNFTPISFWKTPNQTPVTGMVTWGAGRTLQCFIHCWEVVLFKYGDVSSCQVTEDPRWTGLVWDWNKVGGGGIFPGKLQKRAEGLPIFSTFNWSLFFFYGTFHQINKMSSASEEDDRKMPAVTSKEISVDKNEARVMMGLILFGNLKSLHEFRIN